MTAGSAGGRSKLVNPVGCCRHNPSPEKTFLLHLDLRLWNKVSAALTNHVDDHP